MSRRMASVGYTRPITLLAPFRSAVMPPWRSSFSSMSDQGRRPWAEATALRQRHGLSQNLEPVLPDDGE